MGNVYATRTRPKKPYPEFPLFAHNNGQWCRKINGKIHSFGKWEDPQAALVSHNEQYAYLKEGIAPPQAYSGWRVGDLVNKFLEVQEARAESGEITKLTFESLFYVGKAIVNSIERNKAIDALNPDDFRALRSKMVSRYSLVKVKADMIRVRQFFRFAFEERLIDRPVFFGQGFRIPTKAAIRKARAAKPKKLFTATQIRLLLRNASPVLRAMILLAINTGMNNADLSHLEFRHLDGEWLDYPRQKTGVQRRAPLWPETTAAIDSYIKKRPNPKPEFEQYVFITSQNNQWKHTSLPQESRKLITKVNAASQVDQDGARLVSPPDLPIPHGSFGYFRHTFQTRGEDLGDSIAVKAIMGHVDDSISAEYREEVFDQRLVKVTDYVRNWLFSGEKKK